MTSNRDVDQIVKHQDENLGEGTLSPPVLGPVMVKWITATAKRAQAYDVPDSMLSTLTG